MPVKPHLRISALGTLPGGEIFSFGLAMGRPPASEGPGEAASYILDPNDTVYDDIRDDFAAFWLAVPIDGRAALRSIKVAPIGADGRYTGPSVERTVGGANGLGGLTGSTGHPNQVALAVTLNTASDLGRIKGRFYLPLPGVEADFSGVIAESVRDTFETAAATLINNLNNQPGFDVLDLRVVVASSGRRNKDGSVRIPHNNHTVKSVTVGRTLDTIRSRRSRVNELYGAPTAVASP